MAKFVLVDARVEINGVNLSNDVKSVTVNYSKELRDVTAMGNLGHARLAGLADWSLDLELFSDEAAGDVLATLFPLVGVQTAVKVRQTAAAISATNPEYQGNGMIESLSPVSVGVGEEAMVPVRIMGSDGALLIRATV